MPKRELPPIHPGEIIREEFMIPFKLTPETLADELGVSTSAITGLVSEKGRISVDLALRLSQYFGCSAQFFMNMQSSYDLELVEFESGEEIKATVPRRPDLRTALDSDPNWYDKHMIPGPIKHFVFENDTVKREKD